MQFRYLALIALWTLISGPLIGVPTTRVPPPRSAPAQVTKPGQAPAVKETFRARWGW